MASVSAFYETKLYFCNAIQYTNPLSFEEWDKLPQGNKAAHLFVQFYDSIVQAWHKVNKFDCVVGEDGVSCMCQYLEKNVPVISNEPKRFTPQYIYTVAFNCLDCLLYIKRDRDKWENETPERFDYDGEEISLYDAAVDASTSLDDVYTSQIFQDEFWKAIEDEGVDAAKILNYLLTNDPADLKKLTKRNKLYDLDPLSDVEVKMDNVASIVERIRTRLDKVDGLKEHYNIG